MKIAEFGLRSANEKPGAETHRAEHPHSAIRIPQSPHPGTIASKDFSFWYGEKQALKDINLTLPSRSITASTRALKKPSVATASRACSIASRTSASSNGCVIAS